MKNIRRGTFETNSSSTHSITICTEDEYTKWEKGELYFDRWSDKFITKEEYDEKIAELKESFEDQHRDCVWADEEDKQDALKEWLNEDKQYYSYEEYWDEIEHETYEERYTTPKGEKIIAFGYYGNDY
ncbi:MAG: hypothetical protein IJX99_00830 [Clostridia bacterium]|nr:hypothetical protein [Clostridia bacterium]